MSQELYGSDHSTRAPQTDVAAAETGDAPGAGWRTCPTRRGEPRATVLRTLGSTSVLASTLGLTLMRVETHAGHPIMGWNPAVTLPVSFGAAAVCAGYLSPHWSGVRRRLPQGPRVALTFDDGPDTDTTERILDTLAGHAARATFFVLGESVARHPDLLARMAAEGHSIGLHGWDHRPMTWVAPRAARDLLARARDVVEEACGRRVRWYRSPYGFRGPSLSRTVRRFGWANIGWRFAGRDWSARFPEEVARRVCGAVRARDIVLLHDDGPGADLTAQALPGILDVLAARHLAAVSLDEALA